MYSHTFPFWQREKKTSWSFFHKFLRWFKGKERFSKILDLRSLAALFCLFNLKSGWFTLSFLSNPPMILKPGKSWIQGFKRITIRSWNERVIAYWIKVAQREWYHSYANFNSKLRLPPMTFLEQTTYGFEA